MVNPYIDTSILIFMYMTVWFTIAQVIKNNSIVDIAWGLGFVLIAWYLYFLYPNPRRFLLVSFVTIWGLRLATHIFIRNKGKGEDWRYVNWRKGWGNRAFFMAFFKVFMLQGVFMFFIALPIMQCTAKAIDHYWLTYLGTVVFLFGFIWESLADWQLMQFKKDSSNKGKIMQSGVWAYSRHPNYFGEILVWWGLFLCSIPFGTWYIALLSPVIITLLMTRISGPMLEAKYKDRPHYKQYLEETNAFIPKFT